MSPGSKNNGAGPGPDPFDQLANMIVGLASAKKNNESMARLSAAQRMVQAIRQGFALQSEKIAHLQTVLVRATKGDIRRLSLNVEGDASHYAFTDSEGKPVYVVDPMRGLILITPETVEPIVVDIEMKDGTKKRIEVRHEGSEAEEPLQPPPLEPPSGET